MPVLKKHSARRPPSSRGPPSNPTPPREVPTDLWKFIQDWARMRFGWIGLVVLGCGGIWWQWDHISKLPGVEPLVAQLTQKPLPVPAPGKFNIALAHLKGDDRHEKEQLIYESLNEFHSVAALRFDRLIASEQGSSEEDERQGHERARALLKTSGADVMIWGVVLKDGGKSLPKLYWTPSGDMGHALSSGRYQMTENLRLPSIFWHDLTNVLGLLVATSAAESYTQQGQYAADKLEPFIERVRSLLRTSTAESWNADTRAKVLEILGDALTTYGDQSGQSEALREAIAAYTDALKEYTREKAPNDWAMTQNNLGNALQILGGRESDPGNLKEAVTAYQEALKERTREKSPVQWAMTQNNLGSALQTLGERQSDPARLEEAVIAYREALREYTREKAPFDWAMTQNNLGNALKTLGERKSEPARLEEAVAAYREALKEYTREKVPLHWAATQNNLGTALRLLGERESDRGRLEEALAANREALQERRREKVPLDWAMTQNNLGNVYKSLGDLESDPARLKEAVTAYREALKERTREKVPLQWATTQNNLGHALAALGKVELDSGRLEEAGSDYEAALQAFHLVHADDYAQMAERDLRRVRKEIERKISKDEVSKKLP